MNRTLKIVLIAVGCVIAVALLAHLTNTYLFPFISNMHRSAAY